MNRHRITLSLGAAASGLLAAAFLPMAAASADPFPPPFDPNDMALSIDGMTIFQVGTASAYSGMGDLAFADGANNIANAGDSLVPGQFDTAFADGTGSTAYSLFGNFDSAYATGADSTAEAGGIQGNLSNGDFASSFGTNSLTFAGAYDMTTPSQDDFASVFDPFGSMQSVALARGGIFDQASVVGDNSHAEAGLLGSYDLDEVFGNGLDSTTVTGGNFLSDFLSSL